MRDDYCKSVLIVDDESSARDAIREKLLRAGYACAVASNADQALNLLGRIRFHLVVSDIGMEGKDGIVFMKEARTLYPHLQFVIVTGYGDLYSYSEIIAAGAADHITKPFSMNDLVARIERLRWQRWAEAELKKYRERLEELVSERTGRLDQEIKERQRAEEAARAAERKYRAIFENSLMGIYQSTPDGRYIAANRAFAELLGYDSPEDLTHSISNIAEQVYVNPREREQSVPLLHQTGAHTFEVELRRKDGSTAWVSNHVRVVRGTDGTVVHYEGVVEDISERKRSEQALEAANQQLSDIIDFLPDATVVINREGTVLAWNLAMEEMTGIRKEDILGKGDQRYALPFYGEPRTLLVDLVLRGDARIEQSYDQIERRGNTLFAETFVPGVHGGKGGYLWGTASPLFDREGRVIGAIESIRDISERKEMEVALRQREQELENKSAELSETNTALKVLLKRREEDQKEYGINVLTNLKELVFPYLEKLENSRLNEVQSTYLGILKSHLEDISAPFMRSFSTEFVNLSPMELQVASLIKAGKRNKEISEILGLSLNTILTHRHHLRTKLGLKNKDANLVSHLKSLSS